MTNSMRIIAALMDPGVNTLNQKPPFSLRVLAAQHRWQNNSLPYTISLSSIVARHQSTNPSARFLSYNTYLLEGFVIDLGLLDIISLVNNLKWSLPRLLIDLGITTTFIVANWPAWMIALIVDKGFTVKAFATIVDVVDEIQGYIDDCLNVTTFGLWGEITDWTEVTFDMVFEYAGNNAIVQWLDDNGLGPADILEAAEIDLWTVVDLINVPPLRVLQLILKQFGVNLPDEIHIEPKEEVEQRGGEIGLTLQKAMDVTGGYAHQPIEKSYQIMALCEVWRQGSHDRIANNLGHNGYTYVPGPEVADGKLGGSGLLQIIQSFEVIDSKWHVYRACGDQYGDSDYWASKGVLLTRLRIKDGNPPWEIDLFSTHLHWGGELLGKYIQNMEPEWKARVKVRQAQIQELVTFISQYHRQHPRNVAILTGDFNISANDRRTFTFLSNKNEYTNLVEQLQALNLYDQWTEWPYKEGKPDWKSSSGRTDGKDWNLYKGLAGPIYMRDPVQTSSEAKCPRYDHIFLERPTAEHSFMLDISRIQRRHFKRDGQNHEIAMLSDHLGLDAMLFFSPKT